MTDTAALQGIQLKTHPGSQYGDGLYGHYINSSDDKMAVIFTVPGDCNLTGMACFAATTYGTSPFCKMNIQGVTTSGAEEPDGVVAGSGSAETAAFQSSYSTRQAHDFDTPLAVNGGDVLAAVLEYDSGTVDGSNYVLFRYATKSVYSNMLPLPMQASGGTWTPKNTYWPSITVTTDETWDCGGMFNAGAVTDTTSMNSSGKRWAMRMAIPADENLELHVEGFRYNGVPVGGAGETYKIGIWNEAGAEIVSATIDADQGDSGVTPLSSREYYFDDVALLESGVVYYCGFQNTGDAIGGSYLEMKHADGLRSYPGGDIFYVSAWDGVDTWTGDQTRRILINPILSSIHGTGGGGSTTRPTMGVIG